MTGPEPGRITRLTVTDFRSYERASLPLSGGAVYLYGPNGAGKTNILEAVSLLSLGRGLRQAALAEIGRRLPGEALGRAWSVAAVLASGDGDIHLGTGLERPGSSRRLVRLDGQTVPSGRLSDLVRLVWLTPQQDRLFLEGASERRRFFDRLVHAAEPAHAGFASAYEKAMRERMRLLIEARDMGARADPAWLTALEAQMAAAGAQLASARARGLLALQAEIEARQDRPFPQADLSLTGVWEGLALQGLDMAALEAQLAEALASGRGRDSAAGRGLVGPHRGDLAVKHRQKDRMAAECSTGEQKALLLNLVLAQAARLSRAVSAPNPVLVLDEVAAHLDPVRRAALFDEIEALCLQAFLTGTDAALFSDLKGRAQGVHVDEGSLTTLEDR
jgi:DNA replication and repair protein RecF